MPSLLPVFKLSLQLFQVVAHGGGLFKVLILDCPTRGVDIGVKQSMYQLITKMKQEGKAILIISEEMAELIGMCDRLLVMKDGAIKKEFLRGEMNEADIIRYMI